MLVEVYVDEKQDSVLVLHDGKYYPFTYGMWAHSLESLCEDVATRGGFEEVLPEWYPDLRHLRAITVEGVKS